MVGLSEGLTDELLPVGQTVGASLQNDVAQGFIAHAPHAFLQETFGKPAFDIEDVFGLGGFVNPAQGLGGTGTGFEISSNKGVNRAGVVYVNAQ